MKSLHLGVKYGLKYMILAFNGDRFVTCDDRMERWDKGVMQMEAINYSALSGMES